MKNDEPEENPKTSFLIDFLIIFFVLLSLLVIGEDALAVFISTIVG